MNRRYLDILKNKYFIVTAAFFLWMIMFDSNNLLHLANKTLKLNELKEEKAYYLEKMKETKKARQELMKSSKTLERFAREKYFMKKDDEDLFVVIREEEK